MFDVKQCVCPYKNEFTTSSNLPKALQNREKIFNRF